MCRSKPLMFSSFIHFYCFKGTVSYSRLKRQMVDLFPRRMRACAACGYVIALPVSLSCFSPKWQKAASSFLWHVSVSPGFIVSRSCWELSFSVSVGCLRRRALIDTERANTVRFALGQHLRALASAALRIYGPNTKSHRRFVNR